MSIEIALIRLLAFAELVEERLQRLGVAARRAPHDPAAGGVGDVGEGARPAPVGQLVAADLNQPGQTPLVEVVGGDALDDPPDRVPRDPQQALHLALGHLLGAKRGQVLEVAGVTSARTGPRDGRDAHAAVAAGHAPQPVVDQAAPAGEIEMAPASARAVVGRTVDLAAARADQPPARERDTDHDPLDAEDDIDNAGARERQQAVECGRGPHAALPQRSPSFEHPAACRNDGRGGPPTPAQARPKAPRENIPAPRGDSGLSRSTQTSGDPQKACPRRRRAVVVALNSGKYVILTGSPGTTETTPCCSS